MVIQTKQVAVRNKGSDDMLVMLLDRRIVSAIETIGLVSEGKLAAHYLFATHFESTVSTKRESGIHKHIKRLEIDEDHEIEHFGRMALPVRAFLDISIEAYERLRKVGKRGDTPFPPMVTL